MNENIMTALKFAGAMLGLLMLIFLIAVLTPKISAVIDKLISTVAKKDKSIDFNDDGNIYKVRGVFDAQYHSSDEKISNNNGDDDNGKE